MAKQHGGSRGRRFSRARKAYNEVAQREERRARRMQREEPPVIEDRDWLDEQEDTRGQASY